MRSAGSFFEHHKIHVCVGPGGVGKTTVAAALGVLAAQSGLRVLVLTVDPSRRLAQAFGLGESEEQRRLSLPDIKGELWVGAIRHELFFSRFIKKGIKDEVIVQKLMNNKIYQKLTSTLSGSQDFTAMGRLLEVWESKEYDFIILDTPPSEHALDFFQAPMKFQKLFDQSLIRWFKNLNGDQKSFKILKSIMDLGFQSAQKILQKLTGASFVLELVEFFSALSFWQKELNESTEKVAELVRSSHLNFLTVTSVEEERLEQTQHLREQLKKQGMFLKMVVINRLFPQPGKETVQFWGDLQSYYKSQRDLCQKLRQQLELVPVVEMEEMPGDVGNLEGIMFFAKKLEVMMFEGEGSGESL